MLVLDGKETARKIREELQKELAGIYKKDLRPAALAVILVGEDPASEVYVRNKEKACADVGIVSKSYKLAENTSQEELESVINVLNNDENIDGILLQLPLPKSLNAEKCLEKIAVHKDVDGFHPENIGKLVLGLPAFKSCTPAGIMNLLERYNLSVSGKKAVVVGRSNIVGKPLALLLQQTGAFANATVTVCHSGTSNLEEECRSADFLFVAMGKPAFIKGHMVKDGAVVIDVGIHRTENGLVGDCDYAEISKKASAMTPVPGGVGPMTIAQLLVNTVSAYKKHVL